MKNESSILTEQGDARSVGVTGGVSPSKMKYISTRGISPILDFEATVLAGLASDGGLYLPESLPRFSAAELSAMCGLSYVQLAQRILQDSGFGIRDSGIANAYAHFTHPAVAPLKQLGPQDWLLELFHGPTLAFKDFALQFLGSLLDQLIFSPNPESKILNPTQITILGATSGDTGSAAIAGCRGRKNMRIVILHPHERTSLVQRRQMTTVLDENVHNLAIEGSFDDCQNIVKALFTDAEFKAQQQLTAVNSINWARIMAQIVYYFYAALQLGAPEREVSFSVPTGNFGDIYAGWLAKRMGLPIKQLIIASNRNDILTRCVHTGEYRNHGVEPSLSPSMDIQISSNFERLLYEFYLGESEQGEARSGRGSEAWGISPPQREAASAAIRDLMAKLKTTGGFTLRPDVHAKLKANFSAHAVDDAETLATIKRIYEKTGEMLDPHTAVGVKAAEACREAGDTTPIITLATAHPAKFPDAVKQAIGITPPLPAHLADLFEREERFTVLPADAAKVKEYIEGL